MIPLSMALIVPICPAQFSVFSLKTTVISKEHPIYAILFEVYLLYCLW